MSRNDNLEKLQNEHFDLCIIGGGASGAGCALDAALRGLKVALVEKTDFAAETSSKSTKLIHGGVRYLEQAFKNLDFGQLRQVRHGLEERHILLHNAPHLARPLALVTPVFSWFEGLYFTIGLKLYGWFASGRDNLPPSRWLNKAETLRRMPGLTRRLHSAVLYYDGQLDDARYCLALAQSAQEAGAVAANYVEVTDFQKNTGGKIEAVKARDAISGTTFIIKARQFLNCTGPYSDAIRQMANPELPARIRPSKGVHLVLPASVLPGPDALLIPKTPDGRVVFAIPFEGSLLLGTTDHDYPDLHKEPLLEAEEVDFLLDTLQPYIVDPLDKQQVKAGFGGLRPLLAPDKRRSADKQTKRLLRDHEVEYDPASGLLSLLGGKWTTYRLMAKDAVDAVCRLAGVPVACSTESHLLVGAAGYTADGWTDLQAQSSFDADICQHLNQKYGSQAPVLAVLAAKRPELARRLHPDYPYIAAEVTYAAQAEMARTLHDVLARRMRLEMIDWAAAKMVAPMVARLLGAELGWTPDMQEDESNKYVAFIERLFKEI